LREKIAAGVFKDPAEAAFVAFQDMRELDRYPALRQELLKAMDRLLGAKAEQLRQDIREGVDSGDGARALSGPGRP